MFPSIYHLQEKLNENMSDDWLLYNSFIRSVFNLRLNFMVSGTIYIRMMHYVA